MAIAGRIDPAAPAGERARRRSLRLDTTGELKGARANVTVHNISETGLLLETGQALAVGEWFNLTLPEAGTIEAEVIWNSGALHGCRFVRPVGPAVLSAAQLRAAVAPQSEAAPISEAAPPRPAGGATLGRRIAAARVARGLSLGQVAAELGVSRPTVWAWEQDRARPTPARLVPLATALGLEPDALAGEPADDALTTVVEDARQRIAAAAGTRPGRVRILIEL